MTDLSGTSLKGYDIIERVSTGGFGAVYRAIQSTVGREVAIKVILPGYANQPEFIRRFEVEAQIVARLEHLHIVPLHDYWRDPEGAYLVMRYLKGGSLKDLLTQGPFELETAAMLLDQIASALSIAHRNQVIHRDIKPANILLDEEGNAYLADFGIAKDAALGDGSMTNPDAFIGSPDYLAPEQARNNPVSPMTDIYSLGVVLYEMLTGEHPFPNRSSVERLFDHLNEPIPEIETLPAELAEGINAVIQKATAKDPAKRYPEVMELAVAFRQAAALSISRIEPNLVELMTPREQEVLNLIIKGKSNREIADLLTVELSTVKSYINRLYQKLNVRSRVQAIVKARELNLITDGFESPAATTYSHLPPPENPYRGLRSFTAADERFFFGRERMIKKLLSRLEEKGEYQRFLAVIGPSGSGKSSLIKAGLIPALWRGGIQDSDNWFIAEFIPGERPLDELEIALMKLASDQSLNLAEQLSRDEAGLLRAANLILPDDQSELLIVIDQFEELFTLTEDTAERQHFIDLLTIAATASRSRVRVIVSMRADFYDRPLIYPVFADMVRERMETILPLNAEELERAIVEPSDKVAVRFEEGLVASIISEINYQPGALPLLQYSLTELFEAQEERTLTHDAYNRIGRAVGALASRAEEIYNELDESGQDTVRQMFLRLINLGEEDRSGMLPDTRRRVSRGELLEISENVDLMDEVIDTFAAYRLLFLNHDPATRRPTVELAHEALIREWDRLRNWLDDSRSEIRLQRQLSRAAQEWEDSKRDPSYLIPGGTRLEQFSNWQETTQLAMTQLESEYLKASTAAERELQSRESQRNRLQRNLSRGLIAVLSLALLITSGLSIYALNQRRIANEQRKEALRQASIGLASLAEAELGGVDRELGVLLALEAVQNYPFTPQALGALADAVDAYRSFRVLSPSDTVAEIIMVAAWSPDGEKIAAASSPSPNSLVIWDADTGSEVLAAITHEELCSGAYQMIRDMAWSPQSDRLAITAQNGNTEGSCGVVIWDTASNSLDLILADRTNVIFSVDWSADGTHLLTADIEGTIKVWNSRTGALLTTLQGHPSAAKDARFSPDGSQIAAAFEDGSIIIWDVQTGEELAVLTGHTGAVNSIEWSPTGEMLASGGSDSLVYIWDVTSAETLRVIPGHTQDVVIVAWSPDGRRIGSQGLDATIRVWDAATGGAVFTIPNAAPDPSTRRGFVSFSPDGEWLLAAGSRVLGLFVWDTSTSVPLLFGHAYGQEWGGWSPDGTLIATSGTDGSARLWDAVSGEQVGEFENGSFWSSWSPDGTRLVFSEGNDYGALNVWDVESRRLLARLSPPIDEFGYHQFLTMDWSPNGRYILAAEFRPGTPQPIYVWDALTYELVFTLYSDDMCMLGWPQWSPDSTRIAAGCIFTTAGINTPARVWDVSTGEIVRELNAEYGWTYRTTWSPDGTRLLTAHEKGAAIIWDVETGEPILYFTEHQGVTGGEWSPDGSLIVSGDYETQIIKIWDSETGEVLLSFSVPGAPLTNEWSPDGQYIIITGDGFTEPIIRRIWASSEELVNHAQECCVTRQLTAEERGQFGLPVQNRVGDIEQDNIQAYLIWGLGIAGLGLMVLIWRVTKRK